MKVLSFIGLSILGSAAFTTVALAQSNPLTRDYIADQNSCPYLAQGLQAVTGTATPVIHIDAEVGGVTVTAETANGASEITSAAAGFFKQSGEGGDQLTRAGYTNNGNTFTQTVQDLGLPIQQQQDAKAGVVPPERVYFMATKVSDGVSLSFGPGSAPCQLTTK